MRHPSLTLLFDAGARAAFQMLAGTAGLGSPPERQALFPRYARYYVALARLPRRARRALQRRWRRSLAAIALLLTLGQAPALAATLTVAPGAAPDIVPDGSCSLIEAIENANADARTHADCLSGSGADTIVLPAASTQTLTQVHNSTYGATGLPVIGSAVTIDGNGSTIKRNSTAPQFRILAVNFPGNLTVKESTVSGGNTADSGGGILGGALTLMNSTVSGNTAGSGGGIYGGAPTLMNSIVSGNYARLDGGGVSNRGTATLTKSTVSGNSAGGRGGGLFNDDNGTLTLTNSTISGNSTSSNGGGVFNDSYLGPQRRFYGTVTLTNSTVYGNSAAGGGGGLHNLARLFLTNSTVSGNMTAGNGGGVDTPYGTITLTNSTVTGNRSGGTGGGVHMDSQSLYESSILTLDRTLVSGNTAPAGPEISNTPGAYGSATVIANNFNLLGHSGFSNAQVFSGFTPGATDLTPTSDGAAPKALDTILDTALADNGGATKTHALVLGSPAIDAVETGCPPPATDQRGISRPQALACDIGAFEGAIPRTADLAIGLSDAPDPVPVDGQLLYTFTVRNDGPAAATGVQVSDSLPENMVFTSSQGECGGTRTVICELGTLASDAEATVTIHVIPTATGTFTNTATVGSNRPDPNRTNNQDTQTTTVQPRRLTEADLVFAVAATPDPGAAGQGLTYTLAVTNHGPDSATGVTVTDDLPSGVVLDGPATSSQGGCRGTDPVLCDLGALASGASTTVAIDVIPTAAGTLTNRATVNLNETDPDSANNSVSTATTVNVSLEPATPQATCSTVRCALRLVCNLSASLGEDCVQEVTLLVRARDARLRGEALARVPRTVRFAAAVATVPPGQTLPVKLRLTKKGKDIAKTKKGRRLKGLLAIKDLAGTAVTNTPVTIKLK